MKIEAITQSKQPQVVFLVLDDGSKMRMQASVVMDYGLYAGMELDEAQLEEISAAARKASAKARAVRIVSATASTQAALERKLIQKGETPEDAKQAVQWLQDLNLLDDGQVARQLVQSAVRKGYGEARIKQILFEKLVPKQYWDQALALIPDQSGAIDTFLRKRFGGQMPDKSTPGRLRAVTGLLEDIRNGDFLAQLLAGDVGISHLLGKDQIFVVKADGLVPGFKHDLRVLHGQSHLGVDPLNICFQIIQI